MKKMMLIIAAAALFIPFVAGMSYADGPGAFTYSDNPYELCGDDSARPSCEISLSKGVAAFYAVWAIGGNNGQEYAIAVAHGSGNKMYGGHSASTLITWTANDLGTAPDGQDAVSTAIDTWEKM